MWATALLTELQLITKEYIKVNRTIIAHVDNQSAMAMVKEGAPHQRTKHIDVRYRFLNEKNSRQIIGGKVGKHTSPTG
jgi:hypothetical protein